MRYYFTVSENNLICISAPAAMHAYFRTALRLRSFVALGGKRQDMNSINKLTLCIPMYNESSIIADTVKTLTAALEQYREGGAYRRWELRTMAAPTAAPISFARSDRAAFASAAMNTIAARAAPFVQRCLRRRARTALRSM